MLPIVNKTKILFANGRLEELRYLTTNADIDMKFE